MSSASCTFPCWELRASCAFVACRKELLRTVSYSDDLKQLHLMMNMCVQELRMQQQQKQKQQHRQSSGNSLLSQHQCGWLVPCLIA
jgi:hypothetical protein